MAKSKKTSKKKRARKVPHSKAVYESGVDYGYRTAPSMRSYTAMTKKQRQIYLRGVRKGIKRKTGL